MAPRVSIVMPTYQRASILAGVVQNLLSQDFRDFELLIMDDGSTDGTDALIRNMSDARLRYFNQGRIGVPGILNEGFKHIRGEYLIILHDHDIYAPNMLSTYVQFLDQHLSVAFVFSGLVLCDSKGEVELARDIHTFAPVTWGLAFFQERMLPRVDSCVGVWTMIRRRLLGEYFLDPMVGGCADVELWHRLCLVGDVGYIPEPLIRVRGRDPLSQFFLSEADLTTRLLRAKTRYLVHAQNDDVRATIRRHWRVEANRAVLSNYHKCLVAGNMTALGSIRTLANEFGSSRARIALGVLVALPHKVSLWLLASLRSLRSGIRRKTT